MTRATLAIVAAFAAIFATAETNRTATENWTRNRIGEATNATLQAAKEYADAHGGDVQSVNGKTGTVVLAAADVHALPDTYTPPAETDPTVPAWAKAENPPEGMTDNAAVLTNGALKTKSGTAISAANVGAVGTNEYWKIQKGSEGGIGVKLGSAGTYSTFFVGYNNFGEIQNGAHWQYTSGGYEDFFSGSVLRMLTGSQFWWLTGAKPWLQTPTDFHIGGNAYGGGTPLPTWVDNRVAGVVPAWSRNATKPNYTVEEISGAQTADDVQTAIDNAGHMTRTQADAAYYPKDQGQAWSTYWDGDDVRVTVTNYDSVANLPSLYLEQRTNETAMATNLFRVVWSEMAHWEKFLGSGWDWDGQWQGFKAWAAGIVAQIEEKADRAWGFFDSHTGQYAPDGYTSISSEHIMLCKGASYQKTVTTRGDVWVLTADEPYEPTGVSTNGGFQLKDGDGNVQFEIVKGDKVTVKAQANRVTLEDGTTLVVVYNVIAPEHPAGETCLALETAEWKKEDAADCPATVVWSGSSGNWVARITPKNGLATGRCFFKATYQRGGDTYINNKCAVGMSQIVLGGVTYNLGTATISGHTVITLTPAN